MITFVIEDDFHAEPFDEYPTLALAISELERLAAIPWNMPPNRAPCGGWEHCGRNYHILEVDRTTQPWKEVRRIPMLDISATEVRWNAEGLKSTGSRRRS
jgi:hypothetical protein